MPADLLEVRLTRELDPRSECKLQALFEATAAKCPTMVDLLPSKGNMNATDKKAKHRLVLLRSEEHRCLANLLGIEQPKVGFDSQGAYARYAVNTAIMNGDIDMVKTLFGLGVNLGGYNGNHTFLHFAAKYGEANIAGLLLQKRVPIGKEFAGELERPKDIGKTALILQHGMDLRKL